MDKADTYLRYTVDPTKTFASRTREDKLRLIDACGFIPAFIEGQREGETIIDTFNREYAHGGGWFEYGGAFDLSPDGYLVFRFPETGDPDDPGGNEEYRPFLKAKPPLSNEEVFIYSHAWVAVRFPDGRTTVSRMD